MLQQACHSPNGMQSLANKHFSQVGVGAVWEISPESQEILAEAVKSVVPKASPIYPSSERDGVVEQTLSDSFGIYMIYPSFKDR